MNDSHADFRAPGTDRQFAIYTSALAGKLRELPFDAREWEALAAGKLSPDAFDYVAGSAGRESTEHANRAAFERYRIVPRMLRDASRRDMSVKLLGMTLPAPILLAPVGVQGIVHPEGEIAAGRAAASLGIPFILSTLSSYSIESVAESMGDAPKWFQLYWCRDQDITASLVRRAESAGYRAIVVTLDTAFLGWRPRDLKHAYLPFLKGDGLANYFTDPVFRSRLSEPPEADPLAAARAFLGCFSNPALVWDDIAFLRKHTKLPILLKGILHSDDASRAVDYGADGVIVSNHGGRQVDGAVAALDALPAITKHVGNQITILFDSGIRCGSDVLKALALGAKAILLGRPYMWGLAVAGEAGVREVLQNLLAELDLTMALAGHCSIQDLRRDCITSA